MTTSVKSGWARQQYGRDRFDVEIDIAELPRLLTDHGCDPAAAGTMPLATALEILRLTAEIIGKGTYYKHEQAEALASGGTKATTAMTAIRAEVPKLTEDRARLLAPYKLPAPVPEPVSA